MTTYQPVTAYSDSIPRWICPKCGAKMMLAGIEPDSPGHDKRTFECPSCDHQETVVVKFK